MKTMSYTESRARYAETLDAVVNDREEVVITRAGHEAVVVTGIWDGVEWWRYQGREVLKCGEPVRELPEPGRCRLCRPGMTGAA
ncbi:type II toxin-antitoxin system Phd/YefM family antitoxin [Streptomyces sp. NPDC002994]|uniref:type II toxin-antitoxin system Phd/YefM family antitoxin n=1 Tax=Streptomyces sp. NPDC002994 TaxID=3154441 RepID=UPI0033A22A8B